MKIMILDTIHVKIEKGLTFIYKYIISNNSKMFKINNTSNNNCIKIKFSVFLIILIIKI